MRCEVADRHQYLISQLRIARKRKEIYGYLEESFMVHHFGETEIRDFGLVVGSSRKQYVL